MKHILLSSVWRPLARITALSNFDIRDTNILRVSWLIFSPHHANMPKNVEDEDLLAPSYALFCPFHPTMSLPWFLTQLPNSLAYGRKG